MIKEFDKLCEHIKTKEGKQLAKEFRKRLIRSENYKSKLDSYFTATQDGVKPDESAKDLKLI